jgi:two-component system, NtrC family, sensor histidine kinase HydH
VAENVFDELKRYIDFGPDDEAALRELRPMVAPRFPAIADIFYERILLHPGARAALEAGEGKVGRLKLTLQPWMDRLFSGPWDEDYYVTRSRIGRVHVRIGLPQHYMFGAMNLLRREFGQMIDVHYTASEPLQRAHAALDKILDLELAVMLHTFREDLLAQQGKLERLAAYGQLVGFIGHELRNPLSVIETSVHILRNRLGKAEGTDKHLDRIGNQVGQANQIISNLMDLIHERPLNREPVVLLDLLQEVSQAVARPEGVAISFEQREPVRVSQGEPQQLAQLFKNLLENAVHAASPKGSVRVEICPAPGGTTVIFEDSGPGVDESVRRRLFEPLMTTKEKGVGLGLALVKRIADRHEGRISYEPEPGHRARFVIWLPS